MSEDEKQLIIAVGNDYEVVTLYGVIGVPETILGRKVVAYRAFLPTAYDVDQQGMWVDV